MSIFNKHAHQERPYIVIVDIDGTISEATEDRLHLLPPPGKGALTEHWNEFNLACDTDAPITPVIDMVRQLSGIYTLWFVTGRCEIARDKTRAWLRKHVTNGAEPLLSMRPATDDRNDGPAKIDLLKKIGLSKIAFALEDKIEVARVFRSHGVLTLIVREYENCLLYTSPSPRDRPRSISYAVFCLKKKKKTNKMKNTIQSDEQKTQKHNH